MHIKHLIITITVVFSLLVPSFSQAQQVVSIPDPNLAAAIRQEIGNTITTHTLLRLTRLEAPNRGIRDLTGLEHAHELRQLNLGLEVTNRGCVNSNTISDLSPISGLTLLTTLDLGMNSISDISALSVLKKLTSLNLYQNNILDVSPLTELTELSSLWLNFNLISDISPLAKLTKLTKLNLLYNNISDVSALAELTQLTSLPLQGNNITDVSGLAELTQLTFLNLSDNNITDVSGLAELTQLTSLYLSGNNITDVSGLAELTQLTSLHLVSNNISDVSPLVQLNLTGTQWYSTGLDIRRNPLSYASINTHIPAMQAKGVEVKFENRTPTTLEKISGDASDAAAPVTVSIAPSPIQSPAPGEPLVLNLNITGGENVAGYAFKLTFDATALRYISGGNAGYLPAGTLAVPPLVDGNQITFVASSPNGESHGDGTLATVTFEVLAAKPSTLRFSAVSLTDGDAKTLQVRTESGEIGEPDQIPGDVNGDGVVNLEDMNAAAGRVGQTGENTADMNGDGVVDGADLLLIAAAIEQAKAAPSLHPESVAEMFTATAVRHWLRLAQQVDLTDPMYQRGFLFLEQLLAILTPKETAVLPNYPNPFNPETWIPYHLSKSAEVHISIYAADGKLVRRLRLGYQPAGIYESRSRAAYWDGKNDVGEPVASGVYFYTLTAGDFAATRKMLIRK